MISTQLTNLDCPVMELRRTVVQFRNNDQYRIQYAVRKAVSQAKDMLYALEKIIRRTLLRAADPSIVSIYQNHQFSMKRSCSKR